MSISAVDSTGVTGSGYGLGKMSGSSRSDAPSAEDFAASIFEQDDADGDGLLSLGETPLDEERFNSIDSDGDGYLTVEELSSDAQSHIDEMNSLMGQLTLKMQGVDTSEMVSSIFAKDDADGDGLLSFEETPLDEDQFDSIDADGDGFISVDELSADMEEKMAEGVPMPPSGAEGQAAASSGSSSSSSESEEEYDTYDLNEDGVVSFDELQQAYLGGDSSLKSVFESMGEGTMSMMKTRMAMEAYQAQMV